MSFDCKLCNLDWWLWFVKYVAANVNKSKVELDSLNVKHYRWRNSGQSCCRVNCCRMIPHDRQVVEKNCSARFSAWMRPGKRLGAFAFGIQPKPLPPDGSAARLPPEPRFVVGSESSKWSPVAPWQVHRRVCCRIFGATWRMEIRRLPRKLFHKKRNILTNFERFKLKTWTFGSK